MLGGVCCRGLAGIVICAVSWCEGGGGRQRHARSENRASGARRMSGRADDALSPARLRVAALRLTCLSALGRVVHGPQSALYRRPATAAECRLMCVRSVCGMVCAACRPPAVCRLGARGRPAGSRAWRRTSHVARHPPVIRRSGCGLWAIMDATCVADAGPCEVRPVRCAARPGRTGIDERASRAPRTGADAGRPLAAVRRAGFRS